MTADGAELRHSLKLNGTIEFGGPGFLASLSGLELEHRGDLHAAGSAFSMTLVGPLRELRKLAVVGPEHAALLARLAEEAEHTTARLTLAATPALMGEMASALPAEAQTIHDAFDTPAWSSLLFALDRYTPVKVGVTAAM